MRVLFGVFAALCLWLFFAACAYADQVPWRESGVCDVSTATPRGEITPGMTVIWCPDATTGGDTSPPITAATDVECPYDDGGTGATVTVYTAHNGNEWIQVPPDTSCSPGSGSSTCSHFRIRSGITFYVVGGTDGSVLCTGRRGR